MESLSGLELFHLGVKAQREITALEDEFLQMKLNGLTDEVREMEMGPFKESWAYKLINELQDVCSSVKEEQNRRRDHRSA